VSWGDAIRKLKKRGIGLNGTQQILVYADGVNLLGKNFMTVTRREILLGASKEVCLQEKTTYDVSSAGCRTLS
jgi:hypothetical protein